MLIDTYTMIVPQKDTLAEYEQFYHRYGGIVRNSILNRHYFSKGNVAQCCEPCSLFCLLVNKTRLRDFILKFGRQTE